MDGNGESITPREYTKRSIEVRFRKYVKVVLSGCHEWQGSLNNKGYGMFNVNGRPRLSHRVAWEIKHGPIQDGMDCLHTCDNPRCCNPEHLWLGTHRDNMRDAVRKGRLNRRSGAKGEENVRSKLTERDVIEIREVYASGGRTQKQLASAYRVTEGLIGHVVRREAWRHI